MSEITDSQKAQIAMLSGLNLDNDEVAQAVGVSESSVSKYTNVYYGQVMNDDGTLRDDWKSVYWEIVMGDVFDAEFKASVGDLLR